MQQSGCCRITRVLIVDRNEIARRALLEILDNEGYVVDKAVGGHEIQKKISEFSPHVLVVDLDSLTHSPRAGSFREHGIAVRLPSSIPVIVMSAEPEIVDSRFAFVISKPVSLPVLLRAIQQVAPSSLDSPSLGGHSSRQH